MHIDDVKILKCIECGGSLVIGSYEGENRRICCGILKCELCGVNYPVIDEVGVFFRKAIFPYYVSKREKICMEKMGMKSVFDNREWALEGDQKKQFIVCKNWEYQWEKVLPFDANDLKRDPEDLFGSAVFWRFIPIAPEKIRGKVVYVACGGRGREAFHIIGAEPSKLIINEIGIEIYSIPELMPEWKEKMLLLRCDVCHSPLKSEAADITICDHALQHVPDRRLGFSQLVKATKSGGLISICVYSHENNFIMTRIIEPLKHALHKFPLFIQRIISALPAAALYLLIHLFYLPISRISLKTAQQLPLFEHMMFWSHNNFKTIWQSCFDLVHAPTSYHFTEQEIRHMASENNLRIERLVNTHKTLWSLVAAKRLA